MKPQMINPKIKKLNGGKKMKIVEEYIKKRKQEVNENNEKEHTEFLDLITTEKKLLEDFSNFFFTKLEKEIK